MNKIYAVSEAVVKSRESAKKYIATGQEQYAVAAMHAISDVIGPDVDCLYEIRDMLIHDVVIKVKQEMGVNMGIVANIYYCNPGDRDYISEAAMAIFDRYYAENDGEEEAARRHLVSVMEDARMEIMESIRKYLPEYIVDMAVSNGVPIADAQYILDHVFDEKDPVEKLFEDFSLR